MPSTLALFASARRRGNTGQLIDRIALELNVEVVDLTGLRLSPYDYDHRNRNDDFEPLMQRVLAHDQIIFASPIYWYAVSPAMKVFLDRLSDFLELPDLLAEGRRLRGKNAYVVCTSIDNEPATQFIDAFRETFGYLGMHYAGTLHLNCEDGYQPAVHDPEALRFAARVREGAPLASVSHASSMTQTPPPATATSASPENPAPMLDVHAPHETIHTWQNFLTHIAAIVVGLLIAVGLEQAVEFLHHHHQREQLDAALQKDGEANRGYIRDDIAVAESILDWALAQAAAVERAGPTGRPLILRHAPRGMIGSPDAGVWPSAKASGLTNLLPASEQNWLEYLAEEYNQTFVSYDSASGQLNLAYAALDQLLIGHAARTSSEDIDVSTLTAAQRETAAECLRAIAEHARIVLQRLVAFDAANEFILSTPRDQLDEAQAGEHYLRILKEKKTAHPAAGMVLGGY